MFSVHFQRKEFSCKCGCGFDNIDVELVRILEKAEDDLNTKLHINSACRCAYWNGKQGGGRMSQHLDAKAADIFSEDIPASGLYDYFNTQYPEHYGLGRYDHFVHIDVRNWKARW